LSHDKIPKPPSSQRPRGAPILAPSVVDAVFVAEARTVESVPPVGPTEVAIAGRSNVGKSTLLNRLAGRRSLARTSKTPGRTRGIIFYDLRLAGAPVVELRLADMPGFGYAQVAQSERASWQPLIEGYTQRRHTLALFTVLVDSRRGLQAEEKQLIEWLDSLAMPLQIVFTKVDKLSTSDRGKLVTTMRKELGRVALPAPLLLSAETGEGVVELWQLIFKAIAAQAAELSPDRVD
jgi:GTP-binding protein